MAMVTYWLNYPHKKSWQGTHTQYSCSNGLLEKDCPTTLSEKDRAVTLPVDHCDFIFLTPREEKKKHLHPATAWLTGFFIFQHLLFGNLWYISALLFPGFFCYPLPWPSVVQPRPLWRRARPQSTPAPRQRQRKCSAGGSNTVVHAWPWCVGVKRRDEKSCGYTKIWRSLHFGLGGGQNSGVPTFPFMNGVFAMKIHALTIYIYSRLAHCIAWFSSATITESLAWAICTLDAPHFLTPCCSCKCPACR